MIEHLWWIIPSGITVVGVWWALFWVGRDKHDLISGLGSIFALVPALIVSVIAWIIGAVLK